MQKESVSCWILQAGSSSRRGIWNFRSSVPCEERGYLKLLCALKHKLISWDPCSEGVVDKKLLLSCDNKWTRMCILSRRTVYLLDCAGKNISEFFFWIIFQCHSGDGICRQDRTKCALLHRREFGRVLVYNVHLSAQYHIPSRDISNPTSPCESPDLTPNVMFLYFY